MNQGWTGGKLLARFFWEHPAASKEKLAEALQVDIATVRNWLAERRVPDPIHREGITLWTAGYVHADVWVDDSEREFRDLIARVRPWYYVEK